VIKCLKLWKLKLEHRHVFKLIDKPECIHGCDMAAGGASYCILLCCDFVRHEMRILLGCLARKILKQQMT
jgi:hypothetical protein